MSSSASDEAVELSCHQLDGRAIIVMSGELDMAGVPLVATAVERALQGTVSEVEIDLSALTFIDSAGLQSLLVARDRVHASGIGFRLGATSRTVERVIDITGVRETLSTNARGPLRS